MAICIVKSNRQLGINFVLTPERYNPKRRMVINSNESVSVSEIVELSNEILTTKQGNGMNVIQINTADAMGGYLNASSEKVTLMSGQRGEGALPGLGCRRLPVGKAWAASRGEFSKPQLRPQTAAVWKVPAGASGAK